MAMVFMSVLVVSVVAEEIAFAPPASSVFAGIDPLIIQEAAYSPPAPASANSPPAQENPTIVSVQTTIPESASEIQNAPSPSQQQVVFSSIGSENPVTVTENLSQPQSEPATPVFSVAYSPTSSASADVSQQYSAAASVDSQDPQAAPVPASEYGLPGGYKGRSSYYLNDGTVYTSQSSYDGNFQYSYQTPDGTSRTEIGYPIQPSGGGPPVVAVRGSYSYPLGGKQVRIQYLADDKGFVARPAP